MNTSTGALIANSNYDTTANLTVNQNTIYVSNKAIPYIAYYKANLAFISGATNISAKTNFTTPANTAYMKVTYNDSDISSNIQLFATGTNGQSGVGGILGYGYEYTKAVTTATESNVNSGVYNCINFGTIDGGYSTGGIVGCDASIVENVINFGTVNGTINSSTGGIIGAIRSANKTNNTRQLLALDGAINYGSVAADNSSNPPLYLGGIIGNIDVLQDTANHYGTRRYEHTINTTTTQFVGNMLVEDPTLTTLGLNTIIDLTTNAVKPSWETSPDTNFNNAIIYKTGGLTTDPTSIYFQDTVNDSNSFFWRVGESLPSNNNWFVYLPPAKSARNTANGDGTYSPYPNGIYALTTNVGKKGGYYPASNVILQNCDPILLNGSGYTDWRTTVLPGNSASVVDTMRNFYQIKLNTANDILSLQITSGGTTPTTLRDGVVDKPDSQVIFYVVKDNFTPAVYTPDMYSVNTVLSDAASFSGNVSMDMTSGFTFVSAQQVTFTLTVMAEDGNTKNWTIIINTVPVANALVLTQVKEGVNIMNSTASPPVQTFSQSDAYDYTLTGNTTTHDSYVSCVHNDTLILCFNTTGLLPTDNLINSVTMQTSAGGAVTDEASSTGIGNNNNTYYKVVPTVGYGVDTTNFKEVSSDYINYIGTLTLNIRLHSNLNSGGYKILVNTVYGIYTINFTRELSSEAEVQISPSVYLISGTATTSINSAGASITNSAVYYGNVPDITKVNSAYGMFNAKPTISKNATMSAQTFTGSTINANGSRTYSFTFTITSENGTIKNWTITITTNAYNTTPAAIQVDYNGTTYFGAQVNDPNTFEMNQTQSGSYTVRYDCTAGSTGTNQLYNILNNSYYTYQLYQNNILVPTSSYASFGISITQQAVIGNYLSVSIVASASLPTGAYELRAFYYRPPVPI